jgi:hypothetical protein
MTMTITASRLRKNIYRMLDEVAETGVPIQIRRKGAFLRIIAEGTTDKLANLKVRKVLRCKPEEIVHLDWSGEWKE